MCACTRSAVTHYIIALTRSHAGHTRVYYCNNIPSALAAKNTHSASRHCSRTERLVCFDHTPPRVASASRQYDAGGHALFEWNITLLYLLNAAYGEKIPREFCTRFALDAFSLISMYTIHCIGTPNLRVFSAFYVWVYYIAPNHLDL